MNYISIITIIIISISMSSCEIGTFKHQKNETQLNERTNSENVKNSSLKIQLEEVYGKVRNIITSTGSEEDLMKVFELASYPSLPKKLPRQWISLLDNLYPDLNSQHYISLEQWGNYAYYYTWRENSGSESENFLITNYVFRRNEDTWKLTGYTFREIIAEINESQIEQSINSLRKEVNENIKIGEGK